MTAPDPHLPAEPLRSDPPTASWMRAAIWVAIGALIAAAIVCVIWVLVGGQNGIIGRAFLTILLLVAFAGVAILDAHLAPRRPAWFALASMATWVISLLLGAVMIWMPERFPWDAYSRFIQFLLIVLILQLVLLHVRLYTKALQRYDTPFTRVVAIVTITLVVALAALLVIPLAFGEYLRLPDLYWRIVVAVAILAAVGTALLPLVNVLFAPKKPRPARVGYGAMPVQGMPGTGMPTPGQPAAGAVPAQGFASPLGGVAPAAMPAQAAPAPAAAPVAAPAVPPTETPPASSEPAEPELLPWPTFVDGVTPLPMLPDGSPDWNAYWTGYASPGAQIFVPAPAAPGPAEPAAPSAAPSVEPASPPEPAPEQQSSAPGYEGYPPPPPLPPRP